MDPQIRVPVTDDLICHIRTLRDRNGGIPWRVLKDEIDGWRWSYTTLADLAGGRQKMTDIGVYKVLGLTPPAIILQIPISREMSLVTGDEGQALLHDQKIVLIESVDDWTGLGALLLPSSSVRSLEPYLPFIEGVLGNDPQHDFEMRACLVDTCGVRFLVHGYERRKYCGAHDWASGWQNTREGRQWRMSHR